MTLTHCPRDHGPLIRSYDEIQCLWCGWRPPDEDDAERIAIRHAPRRVTLPVRKAS